VPLVVGGGAGDLLVPAVVANVGPHGAVVALVIIANPPPNGCSMPLRN